MRADSNRNLCKTALDYYPTPGWATRALFVHVKPGITGQVWEPACGGGHMLNVIKEYHSSAIGTDIQHDGLDFITRKPLECDWIITNPPYNIGAAFVKRALDVANVGVAIFVRYSFLEGQARYAELYSKNPPTKISQFTERVALVEGHVSKTAGSAVPYVWLIWLKNSAASTIFTWIPPCKTTLAKPHDYF